MTSSEVKSMMIKCQDIQKENHDLKFENTKLHEKINMLESLLVSSGIEIDEKFNDKPIGMAMPSQSDLDKYRDVTEKELGQGFS